MFAENEDVQWIWHQLGVEVLLKLQLNLTLKKKTKKKHMHSLRSEQLKVTLTGRPLLLGDDIMRWCNLIAH